MGTHNHPITPAISTAGRGAASAAPAFWAVSDVHTQLNRWVQPLLRGAHGYTFTVAGLGCLGQESAPAASPELKVRYFTAKVSEKIRDPTKPHRQNSNLQRTPLPDVTSPGVRVQRNVATPVATGAGFGPRLRPDGGPAIPRWRAPAARTMQDRSGRPSSRHSPTACR